MPGFSGQRRRLYNGGDIAMNLRFKQSGLLSGGFAWASRSSTTASRTIPADHGHHLRWRYASASACATTELLHQEAQSLVERRRLAGEAPGRVSVCRTTSCWPRPTSTSLGFP